MKLKLKSDEIDEIIEIKTEKSFKELFSQDVVIIERKKDGSFEEL